jgi:hypothetical protein
VLYVIFGDSMVGFFLAVAKVASVYVVKVSTLLFTYGHFFAFEVCIVLQCESQSLT